VRKRVEARFAYIRSLIKSLAVNRRWIGTPYRRPKGPRRKQSSST
jgi:hypothetical protein